MKKIFFFLFLVLLTGNVIAQNLTVRNNITGQPVEHAVVSVNGQNASALTNSKGIADVSRFVNEDLTISVLGYKSQTLTWQQLEKNGFRILLQPLNYSLDEVVVSANRWSQSRREVISKITTIGARELDMMNPQTTADLVGITGEVFVQKSQQGGGSPMIRGFATNRVLITVDGVRMNNAIFRSGNLQNIISIDPFSVQMGEVLFGPGSVMYGSDAIGGVMNFTTLQPKLSNTDETLVSGNAVTRFSTANNEISGHFDVSVGGKKWASMTSISHNKFGNLRMGSKGPDEYLDRDNVIRLDSTDCVVTNTDSQVQDPTAYSMTSILQKIRFKPNERWDFVYGFTYTTTTAYDRYDRLIRYKNGLPRSAEWYYGPQNWMMNNLIITHKTDGLLFNEMVITLAQQQFEESRYERDFNKDTRFERLEKVDAYSANFDFMKQFGKKSKLMYGAEFVFNDVESTGFDTDISTGVTVDGASRYPQATWMSAALFGTYQHNINEKLTLQAGARYNYFWMDADFDTRFYDFPFTSANVNDGALTGSLGMSYCPDKTWILRASASTGFRSPNVDDLGKVFDSEPGSVIVPNPDLRPEYAYNAEIGITKIFAETVKIDVTGFYTLLDNAMVRRDFTLNGQDSIMYDGEMSQVQAMQNAAQATVYGVQGDLEVKLKSGFSFYSTITWQKGDEELDDGTTSPLRHAAPMFGTTRLRFSAKNLRMDLYANYSAKVAYKDMPEEEKSKDYMYAIDADGNPYSPAWYTLNFRAIYNLNDNLSITAGIENLTDQRYRPYSSGIVAAGRNFILSAAFRF